MGKSSTTTRKIWWTLVALSSLLSSTVRAHGDEHPRTPVVWPDAPCIQTVDRSVDPLFEFNYTIPQEDTQLSVDEFPDSRTHQFIGFCRQWPAGQPPPRYISVSDLQRAIDAGHEEATALDDPEFTLETSVVWAGCWTRITADDQRRPITFAAAAEPVVWDTTDLAAGTWMAAGYTWEPEYNLWSRAPWVLRVLDQDPPLAPAQAAAAMAALPTSINFDESIDVPVCVDASAGSTVTLEWVSIKADPVVWTPFSSTTLTVSGDQSVDLPFTPPEPTWGATLLLRATVEQPDGPAYATQSLATLIVFAPPSNGTDTGGTDGGDTGTDTGGDTTTDTGGSDGTGSTPSNTGHCSLAPERSNLPGLVFALCILGLVRRRATRR